MTYIDEVAVDDYNNSKDNVGTNDDSIDKSRSSFFSSSGSAICDPDY